MSTAQLSLVQDIIHKYSNIEKIFEANCNRKVLKRPKQSRHKKKKKMSRNTESFSKAQGKAKKN